MSIRHSFDSEVGLILATTLHSVGALAVVAALVTHIAWVRKLRHGVDSTPLRTATAWLTINGVIANLVGGFMRTYLPGHPTLSSLGDSPWVQVMLIKHIFLFAALGALVYLSHWIAPRLLRRFEDGDLPAFSEGHAIGSWIVVVGVIGTSVLGAVAQITPLGEGFEDHEGPVVEVRKDDRTIRYQNITGTLTSVAPLLVEEATGSFFLADDIVHLQATLIWSDQVGSLGLCIDAVDSEGNSGACTGTSADEPLVIEAPTVGDWTYRITGTNAVNVAWQLSIRATTIAEDETLLAETLTVAPGTFFEINTVMPNGSSFAWDWTTSAVVAFDVHSHFDGEVQYLVEETTDAHTGSFTNEREGGYSLLWENTGATPISLQYRVWGDFEVDSYFPPR